MKPALIGLTSAATISNLGTGMAMLAIPWFVLQTTGSGTDTGLVTMAELAGMLAGMTLGGPWVDKLGPRNAAVLFDLCGAVVAVAIPSLFAMHALTLPLLAVLSLLLGLSRAPGDSARTVLVPGIAERYGMPVARVSTAYDAPAQGARSLGAPVAGVLIAAFGAPAVLYVDAASFALSAVVVLGTISETTQQRPAPARYFHQLAEGVRFLRGDRLLSTMIGMIVISNGFNAGFTSVVTPAYGARVLHSAVAIGLITAASGAALIIGSIMYSWLGLRLRRWPTIVVCYLILLGPRMAVFLLHPPLWVLVLVCGVSMLAFGPLNPIIDTVKAERTAPEFRARAYGAIGAAAMIGMPLGSGLAGVLIDGIGLTATIAVFAAGATLVSLCPLVFKAWREVDAPTRTAVLAV